MKTRKDAPGKARAGKAGEPPAKVSKKALRSAATRAALKDAVVRCFAEKGFLDTTIDEITRAAGVSHAAFYLYFKDKQEVHREIAEETARGFLAAAAPLLARAGSTPVPELVRELAEAYLDYYYERRGLLRALVRGINPEIGVDAARAGVIPESASAISDVIVAYAGARGVALPYARFVGAGWSAMWLRVMLQYIHENDKRRSRRSREEAAEALVHMTAGGVASMLRDA